MNSLYWLTAYFSNDDNSSRASSKEDLTISPLSDSFVMNVFSASDSDMMMKEQQRQRDLEEWNRDDNRNYQEQYEQENPSFECSFRTQTYFTTPTTPLSPPPVVVPAAVVVPENDPMTTTPPPKNQPPLVVIEALKTPTAITTRREKEKLQGTLQYLYTIFPTLDAYDLQYRHILSVLWLRNPQLQLYLLSTYYDSVVNRDGGASFETDFQNAWNEYYIDQMLDFQEPEDRTTAGMKITLNVWMWEPFFEIVDFLFYQYHQQQQRRNPSPLFTVSTATVVTNKDHIFKRIKHCVVKKIKK